MPKPRDRRGVHIYAAPPPAKLYLGFSIWEHPSIPYPRDKHNRTEKKKHPPPRASIFQIKRIAHANPANYRQCLGMVCRVSLLKNETMLPIPSIDNRQPIVDILPTDGAMGGLSCVGERVGTLISTGM